MLIWLLLCVDRTWTEYLMAFIIFFVWLKWVDVFFHLFSLFHSSSILFIFVSHFFLIFWLSSNYSKINFVKIKSFAFSSFVEGMVGRLITYMALQTGDNIEGPPTTFTDIDHRKCQKFRKINWKYEKSIPWRTRNYGEPSWRARSNIYFQTTSLFHYYSDWNLFVVDYF